MNLFDKEEYGFGSEILTENEFSLLESCSALPKGDYPHRMDYGYISVCLNGCAEVEINMTHLKLVKNKLIIVFPGQIVSVLNMSNDFSFLYIKLSPKFMSEILFRFPPAFVGFIKENCSHLMAEWEFNKFYNYYFGSLKFHYEESDNLFRREIIVNILRNFFLDTCDKIKKNEYLEHSSRSRKNEIMERFCNLVMTYFKTNREVSFYAEKLHITPKYLSVILKELDVDGRSAKEWIDSYIIVEIKLMLKSTDLSILQISEELNFVNASFFCKYFKSRTGMSPKEYREGK